MKKATTKSYIIHCSTLSFLRVRREERKSWLIFHCHRVSVYTYICIHNPLEDGRGTLIGGDEAKDTGGSDSYGFEAYWRFFRRFFDGEPARTELKMNIVIFTIFL